MPLTENHTAYDPGPLEPREDGRSRFALPVSPSGVPQHQGSTALGIFERLLAQRIEESAPATETVTVPLKRVLYSNEAGYFLTDARPVSFTRAFKQRKTEKLSNGKKNGALLDNILLTPEGFSFGKDAYVWEAVLDFARQEGLTGLQLRRVSELACRIVLARNGAPKNVLNPANLPL